MVGMHVVKLTILLSDVRGEPRIDVVMLGLPMVRPVWFVIPIVMATPEAVSKTGQLVRTVTFSPFPATEVIIAPPPSVMPDAVAFPMNS